MTITLNGSEWPIMDGNCDCAEGRWCCTRCGVIFGNNLQANNHEFHPGHKCQWLCFEHGVQRVQDDQEAHS